MENKNVDIREEDEEKVDEKGGLKDFGKILRDFIQDLIRTFPDKITMKSNKNLFEILDVDNVNN